MTKGTTIHRSIKSKVAELSAKDQQLDDALNTAENRIVELSQKREKMYLELAATYLPEFDAKSIERTLTELRELVQDNFDAARHRRHTIDALREENRSQRRMAELRVDELTKLMDETEDLFDERHTAMASRLRENTEYQKLDEERDRTQEKLEADKKRYASLEIESKKNVPGYENDRMFMYLFKRGYGTLEYKKDGWLVPLDRLLAAHLNFLEQRKVYRGLTEGLAVLKRRIERGEEQFETLETQIADIEKKTSAESGVDDAIAKGTALKVERDTVLQRQISLDENYAQLGAERADIDNTKGSKHREALDELSTYLKGQTIADLRRQAQGTTTTADDDLVNLIERTDSEIDAARAVAAAAKRDHQSNDLILSGLNSIETKFRTKDYESSNSRFSDSFNVDEVLNGYISGKYGVDEVNTRISAAQHFYRPPTPTYRTRMTSSRNSSTPSYQPTPTPSYQPSSTSRSSGGGFGGGGFRSGGGMRSGGGFRSGRGI